MTPQGRFISMLDSELLNTDFTNYSFTSSPI